MEGEPQKHYELRSRSRSRSETPQTLSRNVLEHEGSEHHYELRNKSKERSMTPGEVSSSRRSTSRSLPSTVVKARTKNMDTIAEQKDETLTDNSSETQSKSSEKSLMITKTTKKVERRSERQRVKRQLVANGQSEVKDNSAETKDRKRQSLTPKRIITSDYSSEDGDREDVPSRPGSAYEFYKHQGDYWNKFPKTDYTYSPTSKHRYEVAPGILAMPNMSRKSIHTTRTSEEEYGSEYDTLSDSVLGLMADTNRLNNIEPVLNRRKTIRREYNDEDEDIYEYSHEIRKQLSAMSSTSLNSPSSYSYRSSDFTNSNYKIKRPVTYSDTQTKSKSNIFTWVSTILHIITFGYFKKASQSSHYYHRHQVNYNNNQNKRGLHTIMRWMYLLLIKILLLDTWLLSKVSTIRQRIPGRHKKTLCLVLLPLLLFVGSLFLQYTMSAIPLFTKEVLSQIKHETPVVQSNVQEHFTSQAELRKTLDLYNNRIQHLENVTSVQFEKLLSMKQELEDQKNNREKCKSEEFDVIKVEFQKLKNLYAQLKTCCDSASNAVNSEEIRKEAEKIVTSYFGDEFSKEDVLRIFQIMNSKIQQKDLQQSTVETEKPSSGPSNHASLDEIRKIIMGILTIYDSDKTGKVDHALETAGGQVISTRCTQNYNLHTRAFKILGLFTLYYESNNPRTVIQGNKLQPGMCWAFQDFPGYLLIKLRSQIYVTGFTIEHARRLNLPDGEMKSAPKRFNVWGYKEENDKQPVKFGEYEFANLDESLQYFPVQNTMPTPYEYVELRIHSNHGELDYTCLYRFRVHGNTVPVT